MCLCAIQLLTQETPLIESDQWFLPSVEPPIWPPNSRLLLNSHRIVTLIQPPRELTLLTMGSNRPKLRQ
jgi:hypothetical protein